MGAGVFLVGPGKLKAKRFMSPPNALGIKKRIYVQCPPTHNTLTFLEQLAREAVDRHMQGRFTTSEKFGAYIDEKFLPEYPQAAGLRASSLRVLKYALTLARPTLGSIAVAGVDSSAIARLIAALKDRRGLKKNVPLSDRTIALTVRCVKIVLNWAYAQKDIPIKPEFKIPPYAQRPLPRPYTREEAVRLLNAAQDDIERAQMLLIFDAGLRKGEVLGLQEDQIDFARHILTVDRQAAANGRAAPTKSGRARRLRMSPYLETALRKVIDGRLGPKGGSRLLFPSEADPNIPKEPTSLTHVWERARKKAKLHRTRVHDGRHAFATYCTDDGIPAFALRDLLGHSDIRTTQGYVHPTPTGPRSIFDPTIGDQERQVQHTQGEQAS